MPLQALQTYLASNKIDAFLLKISDAHQSEYVVDYFNAVKYFTGFTGSNATLLITSSQVVFYTDSRYFLQSELELADKNISLAHQQINSFNCSDEEISLAISQTLVANSNLYLQGELFSIRFFEQLSSATRAKNIAICLDSDILDKTWFHRPACNFNTIYPYPSYLSSTNIKQKIAYIRRAMARQKANYYLVSSLEDVAYFTHLRGSDVPFNPIFFAYLLFTPKEIILFINLTSVDKALQKTLANYFILIDYSLFNDYINKLTTTSIYLDLKRNNAMIYQKLTTKLTIKSGLELIEPLKISKNRREIWSMAKAHTKDGLAMLKFLYYLKLNDHRLGTDWELSNILLAYRQEQPNFVMQSFTPILSFAQDGAMVHRSVNPKNATKIVDSGLLLIDTGAHYLGGTTDLTRTIAIGKPSYQQKKDYTLVLKAHIKLASSHFKTNTKASELDAICRSSLQENGLDYGHGTGHGVGAMLSVHEGQTRINKTCHDSLPKHFVCSIEPGLYIAGKYGIRLENLYYTKATYSSYKFNVLTLCPWDKSLIIKELLSKSEIKFIDDYHRLVYKKLKKYLAPDELIFLKETTSPLKSDD